MSERYTTAAPSDGPFCGTGSGVDGTAIGAACDTGNTY